VSEVWDRRVECGLINDSFEVRGVEEWIKYILRMQKT
jgi:hypothetical protein